MRAVLFLLGTWPRRRRLALAGVALLAAGSLGFVLLASLGARRSGTAWEHLRQQARAEDVLLDTPSLDAARDLAERASQVSGVDRAAGGAYGYLVPEGRLEDFFGGVVLPLTPGALEEFQRPVLTGGRRADPSRADEVVVNAPFLAVAGVALGDRLTLVDGLGLIHQPVTIVGVGVIPSDFTYGAGSPIAYPTDAFVERWEGELQTLDAAAFFSPFVLIAGREAVEPAELRARLDESLPADLVTGVNDAETGAALVVDALDLLRNAYLALALVGGLAGLSILGLILSRVARLQPADRLALSALGYAPRQLRWSVMLPGALVAVVGGAGAGLLARLGHAAVPTGIAGRIDAGRGVSADAGFLLVGALVATGVVVAVVALAARPPRPARDRPRTTGAGSLLWRWPAVGAGLRAASGGLASAGRRQATAAFAAVAIATVGISAVAVVVDSREGLSENPDRVGKFFDVFLYSYVDPAAEASDRDALLASPNVSGVATIEVFTVRAEGIGTPAIAVTSHKGGMGLTILTGRPPVGPDEVLAATPLLDRLELGLGDSIEVAGPAGGRDLRIVGTAAMPFAATTATAEELALTPEGRQALGIEPLGMSLGVDLIDRSPLRDLRAGFDTFDACNTPELESILGVGPLTGPASGTIFLCVPRRDVRATNLEELGALPAAMTGLLASLGVAGLAYLLGASLRRARRDLAVLRVLGFTRAQSVVTTMVQAGAVGLVGSIVALPLGVALGRTAWKNIATGIGFAPTAEVSLLGTVGVVAGAFLVAVALAAPFAARTLSRPAAYWLRAE